MEVEQIYYLMENGDITDVQIKAYFSQLMKATPKNITIVQKIILESILKK